MKIVHVDLSEERIRKEEQDHTAVRKYLGGRGWGAYFLNRLLLSPQSVDPLAPQNFLIITPGLLAGTPVPSASRCTFTAKSPITGAYGYSTMGGHFGAELRMAGIASIAIVGKADHPVYLFITEDEVFLNDADHLWGKTTWETEDTIRKEEGEVQVCSIGQAGENLVRFASIIHKKSRAAGRCGMGAVMGSKMLKAVAVRGEKGVFVADISKLEKTFFKVREALESSWFYPIFSKYGSSSGMLASQVLGLLPTKHYLEGGSYDNIDLVTGEALYDQYVLRNLSCSSCTIHCDRVFSDGTRIGSGCEHYHLSNVGVNLLASDLGFILRMVNRLNELGMDVGDACETVSWLTECCERNIISKEEIGIPLSWGGNPQIESLIELIAHREGIGDILAEGPERAAEKVGGESKKYLFTVKGMTLPANDPRGDPVWGLGFAVGVRGADHLSFMSVIHRIQDKALAKKIYNDETFSEYRKIEGKGFLVKMDEDCMAVIDSLGICKWNYTSLTFTYTLEFMAELTEAVTGYLFDKNALSEIGERIYNTEKVFNMKMGMNRTHDTLPYRFLKEPLKSGVMQGNVVPLEFMLDEYYRARRWDIKTGLPSEELLRSLGVEV